MSVVTILKNECWEDVCTLADLVPNSGVCALISGQQIAIFYLPGEETPVYALHNRDPIGQADVISRGILGSIDDELVVASPLYKQHFSLNSGACLEQPEHALQSYKTRVIDGCVQVLVSS